MWLIGMENLTTFSARKIKKAAAVETKREKYFSAEKTVRVEVKGKIIPTSFLKIEEGPFVWTGEQRNRDS